MKEKLRKNSPKQQKPVKAEFRDIQNTEEFRLQKNNFVENEKPCPAHAAEQWYQNWKKANNVKSKWKQLSEKICKRAILGVVRNLIKAKKTVKNHKKAQSIPDFSSMAHIAENPGLKIIKLHRCQQPLENKRDENRVNSEKKDNKFEEKYLKPNSFKEDDERKYGEYKATIGKISGLTKLEEIYAYYRQKA